MNIYFQNMSDTHTENEISTAEQKALTQDSAINHSQEASDAVKKVIAKNAHEIISIDGQEYPLDTTEVIIYSEITPEIKEQLLALPNLTKLFAPRAYNIPKELVNLTELYTQAARTIPKELVNLKELLANSAEEIPRELINLEVLYAQNALEIPSTLTKLHELLANTAKEIPRNFVNLESLWAKNAIVIPTEFKKLKELFVDGGMVQAIDVRDFPDLKYINGDEIDRTFEEALWDEEEPRTPIVDNESFIEDLPEELIDNESLDEELIEEETLPPTSELDEDVEKSPITNFYFDDDEAPKERRFHYKHPEKEDIVFEDYSRNATFVEVNGEITEEVKENLLKLPNLIYLNAPETKHVPQELVNLEFLHAQSALEIPETLVNLRELFAHKVTSLPKELVHLETLGAMRLKSVPREFTELEEILVPEGIVNIKHFSNLKRVNEKDIKPPSQNVDNSPVIIENAEYDRDATEVTIDKEITPEIEKQLLKLKSLTCLIANNSSYIPALPKLEKLYAQSAKNLPHGLVYLRTLVAPEKIVNQEDFPSLHRLNNIEIAMYHATFYRDPSEIKSSACEEALSTINIDHVHYNKYIEAISLEGEITPEVERQLLRLPNLIKLRADNAKNIPESLINLETLIAPNATKIPHTLTKLENLTISENASVLDDERNIPSCFPNLTNYEKVAVTYIGSTEYPVTAKKIIFKLYDITPTDIEALKKLTLPFELILLSVKDIPKALGEVKNLKKLHAHKPNAIPKELTQLTQLRVDNDVEIPKELVNLEVLHANQVTSIPTENFPALRILHALSATNPDEISARNLPVLLKLSTKLNIDSTKTHFQMLHVLNDEPARPDLGWGMLEDYNLEFNKLEPFGEEKSVIIDGKKYPANTTELTIKTKHISPEIELELLKLPNLTCLKAQNADFIPYISSLKVLHADNVTYLQKDLSNLTEIYSESLEEIPETFTNLKIVHADKLNNVPSTLTKLEVLHANNVKSIPGSLTKLKELHALKAEYIPATLVNLEELHVRNLKKQLPDTLTKLKKLSFVNDLYSNTAFIPETFINLEDLSIGKNVGSIPICFTKIKKLRSTDKADISYFPEVTELWDNEKKMYKEVDRAYEWDKEKRKNEIDWILKKQAIKQKVKKGIKNGIKKVFPKK